ncbi:MAG: NAD(P)-dependent oxidoreductase [Dermatophilaceae bacterium]
MPSLDPIVVCGSRWRHPGVGWNGAPRERDRRRWTMSPSRVAVLGLGRMGTAVAERLVSTGADVVVWNRSAGRVDALVAAGARVATTAAQAVAGRDVVVTMVADEPAVTDVLTGPDGAAAGMSPGTVVAEMSTIGPDAVHRIAALLPERVGLVDAPVGGSSDRAAVGRLAVLVGGRPEDVDRALPVLDLLGAVRRCGPLGSGAAAKLISNAASISGMTLLGEARRLARSLDVDDELVLELLRGGPLAGLVARAENSGAGFAVELAAKDLRLATTRRHDVDPGATHPVLAAAADVVREVAARHPRADLRALADPDLVTAVQS